MSFVVDMSHFSGVRKLNFPGEEPASAQHFVMGALGSKTPVLQDLHFMRNIVHFSHEHFQIMNLHTCGESV